MNERSTRLRIPAFLALLFSVAIAATFVGCSGSGGDGWPADRTGPKVVVSFAPLYCFAVNVAGDDAVVRSLMTTSGPHHFNPTDRDAKLRCADLFLINGLDLEGDKPAMIAKSSGNKKLKLVDLTRSLPAEKLFEGSCQHDHGDGGHKHEHGKDPHVWLSPDYAIHQVEAIRDALKEADPAHAADYDSRTAAYIKKLEQLKADGIAMLKDKKDRKLVTFHDSMVYFAKTFDLNIVGVVQKNPGTEPNDPHLRKLIQLCADDKNPVRIITVEPQYNASAAARQVVKELEIKKVPDPKLVEFDTLETVQPEHLNAGWYEARMRANLEALAKAMQ